MTLGLLIPSAPEGEENGRCDYAEQPGRGLGSGVDDFDGAGEGEVLILNRARREAAVRRVDGIGSGLEVGEAFLPGSGTSIVIAGIRFIHGSEDERDRGGKAERDIRFGHAVGDGRGGQGDKG